MIRLQLLDRAVIARAMTLMAIERAAAENPVGLVKRVRRAHDGDAVTERVRMARAP